jgi:hypothetical protein
VVRPTGSLFVRVTFALASLAFAMPVLLVGCADHDDHHHIPPQVEQNANADGADMQLFAQALSGEFPGSSYIQSPNYTNSSRKKGQVTVIVVHTIQGSYNGCISWFKNTKSKVSAHYVVGKAGQVTQMVKEEDIGWHAGNSNGYTIGIEHEGYVSDPKWVTTAMLDKSAKLTCYLTKKWGLPISRQHIKGHVELPKQTHTDPGKYWPWDNYIARVKKHCGQGGGVVVPPKCGTCDDKNACTKNTCVNGKCAYPHNNGAVCWDGNPCTAGEKCKSGKCTGGKLVVKCNDNNACTTDSCDTKTGKCAHKAKTGACNDGNPCTLGEVCTSGKCKWKTWKSCADGNACTKDACNQSTGKCASTLKPGLNCKDNNPCTDDSCDPKAAKCVFKPNKMTCSDGNACTKGDGCANGKCVAGGKLNCDDNNKCTVGEHCSGGKCIHGTAKLCGGSGACATGSCQPATGLCNGTKSPNGTTCSDGSPCTTGDVCANGSCVGVPIACDDSNPCTNDVCGPGGCGQLPNTLFCNDGDACTLGDKCAGGFCAGKPLDCTGQSKGCSASVCVGGSCSAGGGSCDDKDQCTSDSCVSGVCKHTTFDGLCDDGKLCTAGDACKEGICAGTFVDCSDNDACTSDRCVDGKCNNALRPECGGDSSSSGGSSSGSTSSSGGSSGSGGNSRSGDAGGTGGRPDGAGSSRPDAGAGFVGSGVGGPPSGGCSACNGRQQRPDGAALLCLLALIALAARRRRTATAAMM